MATDMTAIPNVEKRIGTIPQPVLRLEDIPGSEMEKRALEVALTGGHPLAILYNTGSYATQLIQVGVRLAQEVPVPFHGLAYPWCPCGNYGSAKEECRCSAKVIEKHLSRLGKRVDGFAIWIGATVPLAREMLIKGEPEATILKRVQAARLLPEPSDVLDASCRDLIECYVKTVSATHDIGRVKAVAASIARLDGQDRLLVQHVAEALQYQPYALSGFSMWLKPAVVEASTAHS